ncbi:hypothetical protein IL306_012338 [Fusarium sp. DS 682]|nr:hypothetical protein IL306_012338 [Fusarium sp. DS 682]
MGSTTHLLLVNIYEALRNRFDSDRQALFQMQVPAQPAEKSNFNYNGSDSDFAQMSKPSSVPEAEFLLTDGMLDLSNIVGGPNGNRLSKKYDEVLSSRIAADAEANFDQASEALQEARK